MGGVDLVLIGYCFVDDAIKYYFWYYTSTEVKVKYFKIMLQALNQSIGTALDNNRKQLFIDQTSINVIIRVNPEANNWRRLLMRGSRRPDLRVTS